MDWFTVYLLALLVLGVIGLVVGHYRLKRMTTGQAREGE